MPTNRSPSTAPAERVMVFSPDVRLSVGLLALSLLSVLAFVWMGTADLPERWKVAGQALTETAARDPGTTFVDATARMGLGDFSHGTWDFSHGTRGITSVHDTVAPGLALLDLDADEDLDLVLLGGPASPTGVSVFVNEEGSNPRFRDRTAELGITWRGHAQGICAGDYDRDGDVDLFVTAIGPNLLLVNRLAESRPEGATEGGRLAFEDATARAGLGGSEYHALMVSEGTLRILPGAGGASTLEVPEFSTGASFGDFDRDGWLDLFVANYVSFHPDMVGPDENPDAAFRTSRPAQRDRLYRNQRDGSFVDVTEQLRLADPAGRNLAAACLQLDVEDDPPSVYVARQGGNKLLFASAPPGEPVALARVEEQFGLAGSGVGRGLAVGDADNDGDVDVFSSTGRGTPHALYLQVLRTQSGPGPQRVFQDSSGAAGLAETTLDQEGRGAVWFDYDNDGWLDLAVAHGGDRLGEDGQRCTPGPLLLFRNLGGMRFEEVGEAAGLRDESYQGRGLVAGDLDQDGDLDLVLSQNNGPIVVFENRLQNANQYWSRKPLLQPLGREDAIGMRFVRHTESNRRQQQHQQVLSGGSYLSQGPLRLHFGVGQEKSVDFRVVSPYPASVPHQALSRQPVSSLRESR